MTVGNKTTVFTEGANNIDVSMMPENLYAGIREKSREKKYHKCQNYYKTRITLQEMFVLVMSRYLKWQ